MLSKCCHYTTAEGTHDTFSQFEVIGQNGTAIPPSLQLAACAWDAMAAILVS